MAAEVLRGCLRRRICEVFRVRPDTVLLCDGIDRCLGRIVLAQERQVASFPPSSTATMIASVIAAENIATLARGVGKNGEIEVEAVADLPPDAVAFVASPTDPLGSLLSPADAVRLARACRFLVIDERFAEFAGFSLLPLAAEFDNIVILRSFETWTGIKEPPCAWVVASPRSAAALGLAEQPVAPGAVAAALATLDEMRTVDATLRLLREERSRLYRLLRKFAFIEPVPSWGPFLAARVALVPRDLLVAGLAREGVHVHAPSETGLERLVRIGVGTRQDMDRLRSALLDLAPELVG
jgi:histidinol-phosphate aminotransferase